MNKRFKICIVLTAAVAGGSIAGGCTEALPNQDLRTIGEQTRVVASTYAAETKQNADAAEQKLARAEQLLREARDLFARADAADKRCAERAEKLQKIKPTVITRCPQPTPVPEAVVPENGAASGLPSSGTASGVSVQPSPTPAKKIDPEFSPSDAPF